MFKSQRQAAFHKNDPHLPELIFPCKVLVSANQGVLGKQGFCVFRNCMHIFYCKFRTVFTIIRSLLGDGKGLLWLSPAGLEKSSKGGKWAERGKCCVSLPALEPTQKGNWSSQAEQAKLQARLGVPERPCTSLNRILSIQVSLTLVHANPRDLQIHPQVGRGVLRLISKRQNEDGKMFRT